MRKLLVFISLFFLIFGCGGVTQNKDYHYAYCINSKTQEKLIDGYGVEKDIFSLLKEAEVTLLENKIISDTSKESYLNLTNIAFNDNEKAEKIEKSIKNNVNNNFFDFLSLSSLDFYFECPESVYKKIPEGIEKEELKKRFTLYAELASRGYNNEKMISELVDSTKDFSTSETQRLTLLHLILMNVSK